MGERRDTAFLVHEKERRVMEADSGVLRMLGERLGAYAAPRTSLVVDGWRLVLGDYVVRVGRLLLQPAGEPLGELLDLEYAPLSAAATPAGQPGGDTESMLQAFVSFLEGHLGVPGLVLEQVPAPYAEYGLPLGGAFTDQHAALPYATLCMAAR